MSRPTRPAAGPGIDYNNPAFLAAAAGEADERDTVDAPESSEFDAQNDESDGDAHADFDDEYSDDEYSDDAGYEPRRGAGEFVRDGASSVRTAVSNLLLALDRPLASFHLVVGLTFVLTVMGVIMVLSASSVEDYTANGTAYGLFVSQLTYAALGVVAFLVALHLRVTLLRRVSLAAIVVSVGLLIAVLVPGIGHAVGGGQRWIGLGPITVQPSEVVKVALILWGAHLLADRAVGAPMKQLVLPLVPVAVLVAGLIALEPNLSTAIIIAILVGTMLYYAGLSVRIFVALIMAALGAAVILAFTEGYRSARVRSFVGGWTGTARDTLGADYQPTQAKYSLADGGFFGVGLGGSKAKWSYLPNAHNDFIFAIIGEELGYVGAALTIGMFALLTWVGLRIARRQADPYLRLVAATITTLIATQAIINMGYVVGLLPVTGIQLPLLSAGGNSIILVLFLFGLLASAARHEPEAIAALSTGRDSRFGRWMRLPKPRPYVAPYRATPDPRRAPDARRATDPRRPKSDRSHVVL
ncbi:hypothetical protein GCM10023147_52320 [Tsukamurella soli]|uniref:Probable peptidoglycan glycosyltransferase FtsW n=1 Tax=Tsukamurella soli TaxID=644556 RepID=A0ABP8KJU4_9ACTN